MLFELIFLRREVSEWERNALEANIVCLFVGWCHMTLSGLFRVLSRSWTWKKKVFSTKMWSDFVFKYFNIFFLPFVILPPRRVQLQSNRFMELLFNAFNVTDTWRRQFVVLQEIFARRVVNREIQFKRFRCNDMAHVNRFKVENFVYI